MNERFVVWTFQLAAGMTPDDTSHYQRLKTRSYSEGGGGGGVCFFGWVIDRDDELMERLTD